MLQYSEVTGHQSPVTTWCSLVPLPCQTPVELQLADVMEVGDVIILQKLKKHISFYQNTNSYYNHSSTSTSFIMTSVISAATNKAHHLASSILSSSPVKPGATIPQLKVKEEGSTQAKQFKLEGKNVIVRVIVIYVLNLTQSGLIGRCAGCVH